MKAINYKKSLRFLKLLQFVTSKYTIFVFTLMLFIVASWVTFGNNSTAYLLSVVGHYIIWIFFYKPSYNKVVPDREKIKIAIKILLNREKAYNI